MQYLVVYSHLNVAAIFFFYGHPYHADKTCLVTMQENFPGNWKYKVWYCMGYLYVASGLRPDTALSVQSTLL